MAHIFCIKHKPNLYPFIWPRMYADVEQGVSATTTSDEVYYITRCLHGWWSPLSFSPLRVCASACESMTLNMTSHFTFCAYFLPTQPNGSVQIQDKFLHRTASPTHNIHTRRESTIFILSCSIRFDISHNTRKAQHVKIPPLLRPDFCFSFFLPPTIATTAPPPPPPARTKCLRLPPLWVWQTWINLYSSPRANNPHFYSDGET